MSTATRVQAKRPWRRTGRRAWPVGLETQPPPAELARSRVKICPRGSRPWNPSSSKPGPPASCGSSLARDGGNAISPAARGRRPPGLSRFGCVPNHFLLDMPQLCKRESWRLSRKRASWLAALVIRCPARLTPVLEAKHSRPSTRLKPLTTPAIPSSAFSVSVPGYKRHPSQHVQNRGNSRARNRGRPILN